jgi:hypothetical protein
MTEAVLEIAVHGLLPLEKLIGSGRGDGRLKEFVIEAKSVVSQKES